MLWICELGYTRWVVTDAAIAEECVRRGGVAHVATQAEADALETKRSELPF
jgi:hypothetical protein